MVMKKRKIVFSLKFKDSFQQYILYVKNPLCETIN